MNALDEQLVTVLRQLVREAVRAELGREPAVNAVNGDDDLRRLAAEDAAQLRRRRAGGRP